MYCLVIQRKPIPADVLLFAGRPLPEEVEQALATLRRLLTRHVPTPD